MNKSNRRAIIAGNWKMNNDRAQTESLIKSLRPLIKNANCDVVICPPFTSIETAVSKASGSSIQIGAQNCHFAKSGAYTGEISANMLKEIGVSHVILGHSERRQYFAEKSSTVNLKLISALDAGLTAIVCVGETLKEHESKITTEIVSIQTKLALKGLRIEQMKNVIIAYEPVWAIGTGKTATSNQAAQVCGTIRKTVEQIFGSSVSQALRVLYGGSMNPTNCECLLSKDDIDGGLIGGASLNPADFSAIINFACKIKRNV